MFCAIFEALESKFSAQPSQHILVCSYYRGDLAGNIHQSKSGKVPPLAEWPYAIQFAWCAPNQKQKQKPVRFLDNGQIKQIFSREREFLVLAVKLIENFSRS